MTNITGKIYQQTNAAGTENRFPKTVIEAVYGLSSYLQTQFGNLANIYMPIEGITETKNGQEFVYRKSPQTIKSKALTIDRIKGKTLAWNNIANCNNIATTNTTASNKSYSGFTGTANASSSQKSYILNNVFGPLNHKYYVSFSYTSNLAFSIQHYNSSVSVAASSSFKTLSFCGEKTSGSYPALYFYLYATTTSAWNIVVKDLRIVDMTLLYGSAISGMTDEQVLAKFESEYPSCVKYSEGELISNASAGLETVGFNLWDEEMEQGTIALANGAPGKSATDLRCKNFINVSPSTLYYFKIGNTGVNSVYFYYYDANKNFISYGNGQNTTFTTPSNCRYLRFVLYLASSQGYGLSYRHDICINFSDTSKNGQYEPYKSSVLPLNLSDLRVKSPNVWDEEWDNGSFSNTGVPTNGNYIRSVNFIPIEGGKTYYINKASNVAAWMYYYDANGTFVPVSGSYQTVNAGVNSFTAPSGATQMKFLLDYQTYGTTYQNNITINVSNPGHNGKYYPHGSFNPFPDGLRSAGNVYDEIVGNKVIRRIKQIDLGTLTYSLGYSDTYHVFQYNGMDAYGAPTHVHGGIGAVCGRFTTGTWAHMSGYATNKCDDEFCLCDSDMGNNALVIRDTSYNDAASFKAAMSGVYMYFQQAVAEEFVLETPLSLQMTAGTTERRLPEDTASSVLAPFCCDMTYGGNLYATDLLPIINAQNQVISDLRAEINELKDRLDNL